MTHIFFPRVILVTGFVFCTICPIAAVENPALKEPLIKSDDGGRLTEVHKLLESGNELVQQGKYTKALEHYDKAFSKNESKNFDSSFYEHRAICYLETGDAENALVEFKKALETGKRIDLLDAAAFEKLGDLFYFFRRKYDDALWCYSKAEEMKPFDKGSCLHKKGLCNSELGNFDETIADLKAAVIAKPNDENWQVDLGYAILKSGKFDEYKETLLLLGYTRLRSLGNVLRFESKFVEALYCYDVAIRKNPNDYDLYDARAKCYIELGRIDAAIDDYRTAVEKDPCVRNWFLLVNTLFSNERYQIKEETLKLDEGGFSKLASSFLSRKKFEYAVRLCDEGIRRFPHAVSLYTLRGMSRRMIIKDNTDLTLKYDFLREYEAGLQHEKQSENPSASQHHITHIRLVYELVDKFFSDLQFNKANEETKKLNHTIFAALIDQFIRNQKFEFALRLCNEALTRFPSIKSFCGQRAYCHIKMGNSDIAIPDLEEANEFVKSFQ